MPSALVSRFYERLFKGLLTLIVVLCNYTLVAAQTQPFASVNNLPVNKYMPDPFLKPDGTRVEKMKEWPQQREYLKQVLASYLWGTIPPKPSSKELSYKLMSDSAFVISGSTIAARKSLYRATITRNNRSLSFDISIFRADEDKRYPVILQNYRTPEVHPYGAEAAIRRGYAFVQYNRQQIAPDKATNANREEGIFLLYPEFEFYTIAAWAWAAQPVIDILEKLRIADMDKIIMTGHSRGGQTAVAAAILDERIDMVCPSSGSVYADMSFRQRDPNGANAGDIVARMKEQQPHWHTPLHHEFAGKQDELPFDAATWYALVAPRPFLSLNCIDDPFNNNLGVEAGVRTGIEIYKWFKAEHWCRVHFRQAGINPYGQKGHNQGPEEFNAILDYADEYFFKRKSNSTTYNLFSYDPLKYPLLINWSIP